LAIESRNGLSSDIEVNGRGSAASQGYLRKARELVAVAGVVLATGAKAVVVVSHLMAEKS
jgi:hypothetical protein